MIWEFVEKWFLLAGVGFLLAWGSITLTSLLINGMPLSRDSAAVRSRRKLLGWKLQVRGERPAACWWKLRFDPKAPRDMWDIEYLSFVLSHGLFLEDYHRTECAPLDVQAFVRIAKVARNRRGYS